MGTDRPRTERALVAGGVGAAVALGTGELVAGIGSLVAGTPQSLVAAVGAEVVDRAPGPVERSAIDLFGTADKAVLLVGIVVVCLGLGALVGLAAGRGHRWVPLAGFAAAGTLGLVAALRDPLTSTAVAAVAALAAAVAGTATVGALLRAGARGTPLTPAPGRAVEQPTDPRATRRGFLGWTGAAASFAVATAAAGVVLGRPSPAERARSELVLPEPSRAAPPPPPAPSTPTVPAAPAGLTPYITPNEDFYRIDTALVIPQVEPSDWSLTVDGMVDRPFEMSFEELLAMPMVEETVTLACVSNPVGGDLVGNAVWQGVRLADVLERAGVQEGATQLVGTSVDGWTCGFPTELVFDGRPALLAVGMGGEPLPVRHGFPARVVVAGLYGYVSATKWVTRLTLTGWEDVDGYWIPRGWSKEGPIKTQCRIDVPRSGRTLDAGPTSIAGVAWAPTRGISRVEVRVDDGEWVEARIGDAVSDHTWVQWVVDWEATPGRHEIVARATDGTGETQTSEPAPPDPDGATGWPRRSVRIEG